LSDYGSRLTAALESASNVSSEVHEKDDDLDLYEDHSESVDWARFQSALQLMQAASSLTVRLRELETQAQTACASWYHLLFAEDR